MEMDHYVGWLKSDSHVDIALMLKKFIKSLNKITPFHGVKKEKK